jgi:hypothetical protein
MSTKTIKQRIALVAVSALTAGLFTVVSAPAANATVVASPLKAFAPDVPQLIIGTNADTDGTPDVPSATTLGSTSGSTALTSVGWVADTSATTSLSSVVSSIGTSTVGGLARTGVIQAGGKIAFATSSTSVAAGTSIGVSVIVTGGTLGSLVTTSAPISLSGDQKSASVFISAASAAGNVNPLAGVFSVTAAAGSTATIAAYTGTGIINGDTRTSGTLIAIWTLTVAAANTSGTLSLGDSTVTQQPCVAMTAGSSSVLAYDTTSTCANGRVGVVYVALKDVYSSAVTGGQLAATATGGSFVNVVNGSSTATGDNYSATTAFDTGAAVAANYVLVTQPVANTGGSTTVTITYAGTVVATKTIKWSGDVASITIDVVNSATVIGNGVSSTLGEAGATSYAKNVVYSVKDAAGNSISGLTPTLVDATGAMLGATLSTSADTSVTVPSSSATLNVGYATINHPGGTATANFGAGSYKIQVLNAAGVAVKSNEVKVTVASTTTYSFTASFDKASYVPGDFATLTISAKDVFGNPMPTGKTMPGLVIAVSTGLTVAGSACSSSSTFKAGVKTCSYAVGNTAGSYSWSVALTTATDQAPVTGVVKTVDGAVSNAEVLKSIVALIASINKQIAALQKLILKR